tara:strand:- start:250 stop:540 length:291 start_codon:yes stop_codon:yes gene_type:complete
MDYGGDNNCAEEYEVCLTQEQYLELITMMEDAGVEFAGELEIAERLGDAEAVANFTWQVLFLTPWELAYIALPMSVLAFYGLSIYATFKWLQKKFS